MIKLDQDKHAMFTGMFLFPSAVPAMYMVPVENTEGWCIVWEVTLGTEVDM